MYEKYHTSLRLMDKMIAAKATDRPSAEIQQDVREGWEELLSFMLENFIVPKSAGSLVYDKVSFGEEYDLCRPLINGTFAPGSPEFEKRLRAIPPEIAEVVWPVAVTRWLLRDQRFHIDPRNSKAFNRFCERYANMILQ